MGMGSVAIARGDVMLYLKKDGAVDATTIDMLTKFTGNALDTEEARWDRISDDAFWALARRAEIWM